MCHEYRSYYPPVRAARDREAEDLRRRPDLRASDSEREAVVTRLREHAAAGRLDVTELEERIGAAYAAKTRGELVWLLEDLPALGTPLPRKRPEPAQGQRDDVRVFAGVMLLLCAIWLVTGAGYFWPVWVMIWWGAALLMKMATRTSARARHGLGARSGPGR